MVGSSLYLIRAIVILDSNGKRVLAKYFPQPGQKDLQTLKDQKAMEKLMHVKCKTGDICLLDSNYLSVYKTMQDITIHMVASFQENELVVSAALQTVCDAMSQMLRGLIEKKTVLDSLDSVLLIMDECVDSGIFLESDAATIVSRCNKKSNTDTNLSAVLKEGFQEGSIRDALLTAREQLARSFLK